MSAGAPKGGVSNQVLGLLLGGVPLLTAVAYSFGAAYASGFYGRIGIDNLDHLGFTVQTFVLHGYAALRITVRLAATATIFATLLGLTVALFHGVTGRQRVPAIFTATGLIGAGILIDPAGAGLLITAGLSIVASMSERTINQHRRARVGTSCETASGTSSVTATATPTAVGDGARSTVVAWATTTLALCVVAAWLVLVSTARDAGARRACEIAEGDDRTTPLVELITSTRPYVNSTATPIEKLAEGGDEYRAYNLRLFASSPAGLIVYADNELPERLILVPSEHIVSVAILPDGGNVIGNGDQELSWC
jgi:hypothetical protein